MRCANVRRLIRRVLLALLAAQVLSAAAWAGGPRFVSGTNFCCSAGVWMAWYTTSPQYFTDPGGLNATVSHAQADAMVAAAANVWNVPTSSLVLSQGGELAEHVSGANTYFNGTSVVFPADVGPGNYAAIQIAVIYDTDGSVTDTILGDGASDPSGCRQAGVTEAVDLFGTYGTINHAEIVLNGRCVGSSPQQLTQMQYQLTRAFGQVLGLAWSQLNDNVFTGTPAPTAAQMAHWPLMHPIDVICGTYTYQCSVNAFTLTDDDRAALEFLYPVADGSQQAGKTPTFANSDYMLGWVYFPDGQGMMLANVTVTLTPANYGVWQGWQDVSGVTGIYYQQNGGNPVSGQESASENVGRAYPDLDGQYYIGSVPVTPPWTGMLIQTESINSLYTGEYAIGPYQRPPIAISGSPQSSVLPYVTLGKQADWMYPSDAASSCDTGNDGTQPAPAPTDPSGWWNGLLCPTGHSSWWTASVKANRTFTIETTALDESGNATVRKAQPVLGLWNITNPSNSVLVSSEAGALNGLALGMTQLHAPASATPATVEFVVSDQYGAGRPDFAYRQRFLYADSVAPVVVGSGGGQITITGMGFQQGNQVTVNGVNATVLSWTATQIVADVPPMASADPYGVPVNIAVSDARTGGSTIIERGLTYTPAADVIQVVSEPTALNTGQVASTALAVRVFASDGIVPLAGSSVQFADVSGAATLGCGGGTSCSVATDSTGLAQITLAGVAPGNVTVSASITTPGISGMQAVEITLVDTSPIGTVSISSGPAYLAAGANGEWVVSLLALLGGSPAAGVPVVWSSSGTGLTLTSEQGTTGTGGTASVQVHSQAIAPGSTNTVTGCVWGTVCATWTVYGVAPPLWTIAVTGGAGQSLQLTSATGHVAPVNGGNPSAFAPVTMQITDGSGHALPGAMVTLYQTVYAWEGACPAQGACPAAPVLQTTQTSAMSDANGQIEVTPLQVAGVPQVVDIAAATGTEGFVTMSLTVTP